MLGSALTLARQNPHWDARIHAEIELVEQMRAGACGINRLDPRSMLIGLDQLVSHGDELTRIMAHEPNHRADLLWNETSEEVSWILEEGSRGESRRSEPTHASRRGSMPLSTSSKVLFK